MLIVLAGWLFAVVVLMAFGTLVLHALPGTGPEGAGTPAPIHVLFSGLIAVTALGNSWAYFAPIGCTFALILLSISLVVLVHRRDRLLAAARHWLVALRSWPWTVLLCLAALFAIVLLKSVAASEMYDEGGYYMPYIKWIEQYRIVPGLANIEDRMGFNSAFHMASACFGLAWWVKEGTYDLNGLLLLTFGAWCMGGLGRVVRREPLRCSDILMIFSLFFLMRNMLTSASADLSNIVFGEAILILFMRKIEQGTTAVPDRSYFLIVLYCMMIATIKLSSLFIWLVPAYLMLRTIAARRRPALGRAAVLAASVLVPWLGRFPVLSGYLVYPVHRIDLFEVDWKVPAAVAERQYYYVSEFAKTNAKPGESAYLAEHRGLLEWVPAWFARENAFNKSTALALLLAFIGLVPFALFHVRQLWRDHRDLLFFGCITGANVLLWFLRNPSFRFGWAWAIIFLGFAWYVAIGRIREGRVLRFTTLALFALLMLQNTAKTVLESMPTIGRTLVRPMPVKTVPLKEVRLGAFIARASGTNQCWGTGPPCLPLGYDGRLEARGPAIEDGFRIRAK
jgi:hypothetical protein